MIDTIRNKLDDRGVSPVIGVILMVAITVILAAVIGSFVLGIGGDVETTPQASIQLSGGDLIHAGGDEIPGDGNLAWKNGSTNWLSGQYNAGDTIVANASSTGRLVWYSSDNSSTSILYDGN